MTRYPTMFRWRDEEWSKWLRTSLKKRLRYAVRHPAYAAKAFIHDALGLDENFLASIVNSTPDAIRRFLNEPSKNQNLMRHWKTCEPALRSVALPGNDIYGKKVLIQYALARALAPDIVIETGVANGISSTYLLQAFELNGKGHLYSIDVDTRECVATGNPIGWIVPEHLRSRWTLLLGDSKVVLPHILSQLGMVDIFIHDSLHNYATMKFEFETSYPRIRPGGLLLSDDVNANLAFSEFVRTVKSRSSSVSSRTIRTLGILRKS